MQFCDDGKIWKFILTQSFIFQEFGNNFIFILPEYDGKNLSSVAEYSYTLFRNIIMFLYFKCFSIIQASDEATLNSLDNLLSEFFGPGSGNERKKQIGKVHL